MYFLLVFLATLLIPAGAALAFQHTVAPGDTLYLIGKKYNITATEIKSINGLSGDIIYPGQVLNIPDAPVYQQYTVVSGDTLYLIGVRNGTTYQSLISINQLSSASIYPGQVLKIPASVSTTPAPAVPSNDGSSVVSPSPAAGYSAAEVDLLARLITAEADSESYAAKVAVGAVVLNRVKNPAFPNSINAVIYQVDAKGYYQFTPVENGWINKPASLEGIKAAKAAMAGEDPSKGAIYFWETAVTTNKFLKARPVAIIIGSFTFTY